MLRKRWAVPMFAVSLDALIVQDVSMFTMTGAAADSTAVVGCWSGAARR